MLKNSSFDWYRKTGRVNQPRTNIETGTANGGTSLLTSHDHGSYSVRLSSLSHLKAEGRSLNRRICDGLSEISVKISHAWDFPHLLPALFYECMQQYARKVLDTADIVRDAI